MHNIIQRPRRGRMSRKKVMMAVLGSIFGAFLVSIIVIVYGSY